MIRFGLAVLPIAAALGVFSSALPGDFILGDTAVAQHREDLSKLDLRRLLFIDYWSPERIDKDYRPLTFLTYALNSRWCGEAWGFRAVNVALNAGLSLLIYFLLLELLGHTGLAALGAALYAVLPIHTETVATLAGRAEMLSGMALFGSWLIALKNSPRDPPRRERIGLVYAAGVLTFLGLFTREDAVAVAPFLIVAGSWAARRRIPWLTTASSLSAVASYLAMRGTILEGKPKHLLFVDNPLLFVDALTRSLNSVKLLGLYLLKTVVPLRLSADYSYDQIPVLSPAEPALWAWAAGVAALLLGALWLSRRCLPLLGLAVLFFIITFAPAANALFPIQNIFSERLAYTPSFAFPLALCAVLAPTLPRRRVLVRALFAVLIAAYGARSWARNQDWASAAAMEKRLSEDAPAASGIPVKAASASFARWAKAGSQEERAEILAEAEAELEKALKMQPQNSWARSLYGEVLFKGGKLAEAATQLGEALRALPGQRPLEADPPVLHMRGECHLRLGKPLEAFQDLNRAVQILLSLGRAPDGLLLNGRGLALAQSGRLEDALRDFDAAMALRPDLPEIWNNRGFCRFKLGNHAGALADYQRGLELCRERRLLHSPVGESAGSFLIKMADVYLESAKTQRGSGNEEAARKAEAKAAQCRAEAAALVPPKTR